ncbi:hypothetical protein C8T65DRAFT_668937 [Cerioporus squamosus]|nr:hypothetical protein C8T65DRAFT_668937 [Cerioporus squamosus]
MVTMNGYIMTPVFGGQDGDLYNDVLCSTKDTGGFWVKDSGVRKAIDIDHPIATIVVNINNFIRGMSVVYRVAGNRYDTATFERGSETVRKGRVDFRDSETLLAVFGRAGPVSRNDPSQVIHSIGFVLFDTALGTVRTCGPFGNNGNSALGEHFYVTNVVGFGGFHNQTSDMGLSGLFFVKDINKM